MQLNAYEKEILDSIESNPSIDDFSKSANKARRFFGLYNIYRIFLLQVDQIFDFFKRSFLPKRFGIFGLFYGIEALFYIGEITYLTFFAPIKAQDSPSFIKRSSQRFLDALQTNNRLSRFINAAAWFVINLTCFLMGLGVISSIATVAGVTLNLPTLLTIGGFAFDLAHVIVKGIIDFCFHNTILGKIAKEKEAKENEMDSLIKNGANNNDRKNVRDQINDLNEKTLKVENDKTSVFYDYLYAALTTTILLAGITLLFIPPTSFAGALITFAASNVIGGVGQMLFGVIRDCFKGESNQTSSNKNTSENEILCDSSIKQDTTIPNSLQKHCKILFNNEADLNLIPNKNETSQPLEQNKITTKSSLKEDSHWIRKAIASNNAAFTKQDAQPRPVTSNDKSLVIKEQLRRSV